MDKCKYHEHKSAFNTCCVCGDGLCDDCVVELNGRIYCKSCLSKKIGEKELKTDTIEKSVEKIVYTEPAPKKRYKNPSAFLTFCCAMVPGCAQMYLGLVKRGIMLMLIFLIIPYLASFIRIAGICIPILWAYSFFDAFATRRKIIEGEETSDDLDDIKAFFVKNEKFVICFVGLIICIEALQFLGDVFFPHQFSYHGMLSRGLVTAFICFGIYLIVFKNKGDKGSKKNKDDDAYISSSKKDTNKQ